MNIGRKEIDAEIAQALMKLAGALQADGLKGARAMVREADRILGHLIIKISKELEE